MSADFWGLKTAGGTATAYHLLAAMLAKSHALEVKSSTAACIRQPGMCKSLGQECGMSCLSLNAHLPGLKAGQSLDLQPYHTSTAAEALLLQACKCFCHLDSSFSVWLLACR